MSIQGVQQTHFIKQRSEHRGSAFMPGLRRGTRVPVVITVSAVVVFGVTSSVSSADASRAPEAPRGGPRMVNVELSPAFTSPCFAVRTWDRWPSDVGPQVRCAHGVKADVPFGVEAAAFRESQTRQGNQYHWRSCFSSLGSFRTWVRVQVGMPECSPVL